MAYYMINDNRWGILYCPKHETFNSGMRWEKIERCLKANGIEYDYLQSENSGKRGALGEDDDQ